MFSKMQLLIRR